QTMCRRYSWAAARCTAASGQPRGKNNFVVTWCSIVVHRGHDRFDRIGRDRFIARWMVRASVAPSPKPSAKAPPQEPCPGSKAAKARGRQLARTHWMRRFVGGVALSGAAIPRERGNNRFLPLAHG